jgi:hypothetical protein
MAKSLIEEPKLAYLDSPGKGEDKRIKMYMGGIRNETSEHINLEAVTDSMRVELLQSGRFRLRGRQQGSGRDRGPGALPERVGAREPGGARKFGKQLGAEVVLYGTLYLDREEEESLRRVGRGQDRGRLLLVHLQLRGHRDRRDPLEPKKDDIRKVEKTGFFGRS